MASESKSLLDFLSDPRLALYATSGVPVWLWSADATRILWGNSTAAAIFNAASPAALSGHVIDPKGSAALQIARLAGTLPHGAAPRLERLRGFGGRFGGALLCNCARIMLADRTPAILVVATEATGPKLTLGDQAKRLLAGVDDAVAVFAADGALLYATTAAQEMIGRHTSLEALGAMPLAATALAANKANGTIEGGSIALERLGMDTSTVLLATLTREQKQAVPAGIEKPEAPAAIEPAAAPEPAPPVAEDSPPAAPEIVVPMQTLVVAAAPEAPVAPVAETPAAPAETLAAPVAEAPAAPEKPQAAPPAVAVLRRASDRRPPLRFVWQIDAEGRFTITSDEFIRLIGTRSASALGRPWSEIAATLALDPEGHVARALASRDTWSGVVVSFPADDSAIRIEAELSGLPVFDRDRNLRGYRGFGVCRDVLRIDELARQRTAPPSFAPATPRVEPPVFREETAAQPQQQNIVPFPATPPDVTPTLSPVERKAFSELASRLTARLRGSRDAIQHESEAAAPAPAEPVAEPQPEPPPARPPAVERAAPRAEVPLNDQRPILDRLPVGVLVYRLDKLIYANRAFLDWTGYGALDALEEAGGLDALFVEPTEEEQNGSNGAKSLTIATNKGDQVPVKARLFTSPWNGESALVLMLTGAGQEVSAKNFEAALQQAREQAKAEAAELRAILDTAADGVVLIDAAGQIISVNDSAEVLFRYESRELVGLPFASLLKEDSQRIALDILKRIDTSTEPSASDVTGRRAGGEEFPVFMTIGALPDGGKRCAIFRDLTLWKKAEDELVAAKKTADRASLQKSDFLARISHEIRTPLNAMIGFSEVMMHERFGPIGNDRYKQYLQDIHASGGHLISLLNDLLDLSKIEAGKLELNFANVDLNELTQQCVSLMQPQANRERVIIRTSLPLDLPQVNADARSVRQIVLNLLSNSIKFTGAGGQVIVSTAIGDDRDVILRVRDTGVGMSEKDLEAAMEPFRQLATSSRWGSSGTGLGLPLTKALAEANRARFKIRSGVNAGTLVEVAFPGTQLAAE